MSKTEGKYPVNPDENSRGQQGSTQKSSQQGTKESSLHQDAASNSDLQDASASRGGTTDMDHRSHRGATGNTDNNSAGSGMASKTSVTGSDFDGQVVDQ